MVRSFSIMMLITCFLLILSCKSSYVSTDVHVQNIAVTNDINPIDSQLVQLYMPYKTLIEKDMGRVISFSEIEMVKGKPESGLTNLLSDLLLEEGQKTAARNNFKIKPLVSFLNYGGIRTSLPKGNISVGKIFELMPFENEMVFIELTGQQLQHFFDIVAEHGGESVGGVRFVISNNKAKNITINGENLVSDRKYWLVTSDYSANGGDGLEVFTQRSELINSGKKIRDVIISNFEERQKNGLVLTGILDGRITNA